MRRLALAPLVLVLCSCGAVEREVVAPTTQPGGGSVLDRYGIRVRLPPGWHGELGRGALRAANAPLSHDSRGRRRCSTASRSPTAWELDGA